MKTHIGWVYVAFIVDVYSRRVVGWQASRSLRADLEIDALEMAVHNRGCTDDLSNLVNHSDRGVQSSSVRCSERIGETDIVASVGSRGDSCNNEVVESFNGLHKWELTHPHGPRVLHPGFRRLVQPPASQRINHRRLAYTTPVEHENDYRGNSAATNPWPH